MGHKFIKGDYNDWRVFCENTQQEFSCNLWKMKKVSQGICPYCKANVEIEQRKKRMEKDIENKKQMVLNDRKFCKGNANIKEWTK